MIRLLICAPSRLAAVHLVAYALLVTVLGAGGWELVENAGVVTSESSERHDVGHRELADLLMGKLGFEFDVAEDGAKAADGHVIDSLATENIATPPVWDSTLCMKDWGVPNLQHEPDPNGYVIYVNGREQLGGNKYLVSDGLFMAKTLNRTFVEYPVRDARVASFADSELGLGAYWDLTVLCMYHRILDLRAFRSMVSSGIIEADEFATIQSATHESIMRHIEDEKTMRTFLKDYEGAKVIIMEYTWKSAIERDAMVYLRPNPFYEGVVRVVMHEQKNWTNGNFISVQWRTETSSGDLTECYHEIREVIEERRLALGLGPHQVMFNTDLDGRASGTYRKSEERGRQVIESIVRDYPQAFANRLHDFLHNIEDSGVKAFVSGLTVASSRLMIASSLNHHDTQEIPDSNRCQKPYSGYIHLIASWRKQINEKDSSSIVRIFPFDL